MLKFNGIYNKKLKGSIITECVVSIGIISIITLMLVTVGTFNVNTSNNRDELIKEVSFAEAVTVLISGNYNYSDIEKLMKYGDIYIDKSNMDIKKLYSGDIASSGTREINNGQSSVKISLEEKTEEYIRVKIMLLDDKDNTVGYSIVTKGNY